MSHEFGTAEPRGRPRVSNEEASRELSKMAGYTLELGERVEAHSDPESCPACGSTNVRWGVDTDGTRGRSREEIHPLIWDDDAWMADTFLCDDCSAGWIEPDDPEPIRWVRPWWMSKTE